MYIQRQIRAPIPSYSFHMHLFWLFISVFISRLICYNCNGNDNETKENEASIMVFFDTEAKRTRSIVGSKCFTLRKLLGKADWQRTDPSYMYIPSNKATTVWTSGSEMIMRQNLSSNLWGRWDGTWIFSLYISLLNGGRTRYIPGELRWLLAQLRWCLITGESLALLAKTQEFTILLGRRLPGA